MFGVRRFAAASVFLLSFVALNAIPALSQVPPPPPPPNRPTPPCFPECPVTVYIEPGTGTVFTSTLAVDVTFCSDAGLVYSSRLIKLRGTDVTDDFTYTTGGTGECVRTYKKLSEDTITLTEGQNSFYAYICNSTEDCGSRNVTYTFAPNEEEPSLELVNHNGDNRDRSMCLTAGAGEAAAYQCGDLMVAHSMPGYATKGRDRALTLIYNTSQAEPRPAVAVNVTNAGDITPPTEIAAELVVEGDTVASATYNQWTGATKQIVLAFDASSYDSGLYPFTLKVHNVYPGGPQTSMINDTLIIVNRSASEFGRGWSVAGVEQIITGQGTNDILWIGGDGSAKRYRYVTTNTWRAAAGGYRDTLVYSVGESVYTRTLRHGVKVDFNSSGQHIRTVNRAGDTTRVTWSGTPSRLQSIRVPPDTTIDGNTYDFDYDGSDKLDKITDPASRVLNATVTSGKLLRLTDPDSDYVDFDYDAQGRMDERTNRRGVTTEYAYDNSLRLTDAIIPLNVTAGDTATTTYSAWDERGLAVGTGSTNLTASLLYLVYTSINGPRTDVTDVSKFWIDRWGAPTTIRDPLGNNTDITRSTVDSIAGLPTEVTYDNGRVATMIWNARANLTEQRDSVTDAPTQWTNWVYGDDDVPDSPTIIYAGPDSVRTRIWYDSTLALPDSVEAPGGHITRYTYGSGAAEDGLVRTIVEDDVTVYSTGSNSESTLDLHTAFVYDSLGNLSQDSTHRGAARHFVRDGAQQVTEFTDALGNVTEYTYDALGRLEETTQHVEDSRELTTTIYRSADVVDSIVDPRGVDRSYTYDDALRKVSMTDEFGWTDTIAYDLAGNAVWSIPRHMVGLADTIKTSFDVLNRPIAKSWPLRDRPDSSFVPDVWEDTIPGDEVTYQYDPDMGWLTSAATGSWTVERDYYENGLLKTELQISSGGDTLTQNYGYDGAGRRLWHKIGSSASRDSVWYEYSSSTGRLGEIGVEWRTGVKDSVRFAWDELGRRRTLSYADRSGTSAPLVVRFAYGSDGHMRRLCTTHGGSPTYADSLQFRMEHDSVDFAGRILSTEMDETDSTCEYTKWSSPSEFTYEYDKRGQLLQRTADADTAQYRYDDSGNRIWYKWWIISTTQERDSLVYSTGSNRMQYWYRQVTDSTYFSTPILYSADGARVREWPTGDYAKYFRFNFYDALGRFTGNAWYLGQVGIPYYQFFPNVCKYGPLGRLIVPCNDSDAGVYQLYYDGDNVVRTGADADSTGTWTFVHGPGVDDPLMGLYNGVGSQYKVYLYWLTDGRGRQYVVADSTGKYYGSNPVIWAKGHKYSGGVTNAQSFSNSRLSNTSLPDLSFYRNRFYDQRTGRWLQEDPLGLAAGTNLYQYVGNNPVSYTDPFGLCKKGADDDCELILASLREQSGTEFQRAAKAYDAWQGTVRLMSPPDGFESVYTPWVNYWGGATSNAAGTVKLNSELDRGDLLLIAVHESLHMSTGLNLRHKTTTEYKAFRDVAYRAFHQLDFATRNTAWNRYFILRSAGYDPQMVPPPR